MARTKEFKMGIHEQIIESAGQIYNYLNSKGEVSISKMKKDLSLSENFAEMGLGWLSREDKLEYTQKAKSVTVRLRQFFAKKYKKAMVKLPSLFFAKIILFLHNIYYFPHLSGESSAKADKETNFVNLI